MLRERATGRGFHWTRRSVVSNARCAKFRLEGMKYGKLWVALALVMGLSFVILA
jgi:hypothetical protein